MFYLCCLPRDEAGPARVCFFVNRRIDHKRWQVTEHSRDISSLTIEVSEERGVKQSLTIHNVYNPTQNSTSSRTTLVDVRAIVSKYQMNEQVLLGDFNLHHPMWGGPRIRYTDPESEDLIAIMEDYELSNTLLPGTITYKERTAQSTIDLCIVTVGLVDRVIQSQVDQDLDHDSDHLPISTVLDITAQKLEPTTRKN